MADLTSTEKDYFAEEFNDIILHDGTLTSKEFDDCHFNGCDLSGTHFHRCIFAHTTFTNCNLSLARIASSKFTEVRFVGCKLSDIDLTKALWAEHVFSTPFYFEECVLDGCSFFGLTLQELELSHCSLKEVDFRYTDLSQSKIIGCDLEGALFGETNLTDANLSHSHHISIDIKTNTLTNATFSRYEALGLLRSLHIHITD